jgi:hypothetical protein
VTDGYTTRLLKGTAHLLAAEGVGIYDEAAVIADPDTGIFRGSMPTAPERALALNAYPVEDTDLTVAVTGVQIRMRAGRTAGDVDDLADAVKDVLHNRQHYDLSTGVHIEVSWRQSQAWIGLDTNGRMELTSNYYFRTVRSGPHLFE